MRITEAEVRRKGRVEVRAKLVVKEERRGAIKDVPQEGHPVPSSPRRAERLVRSIEAVLEASGAIFEFLNSGFGVFLVILVILELRG